MVHKCDQAPHQPHPNPLLSCAVGGTIGEHEWSATSAILRLGLDCALCVVVVDYRAISITVRATARPDVATEHAA